MEEYEDITLCFKYKLYTRVDTPLVAEGLVTMLGFDDGGVCYFVVSNEQGVADKWWHERQLASSEERINKEIEMQ